MADPGGGGTTGMRSPLNFDCMCAVGLREPGNHDNGASFLTAYFPGGGGGGAQQARAPKFWLTLFVFNPVL